MRAGDDQIAAAAARAEASMETAFNERVRLSLRNVRVLVTGRTIILSGCVRSWAEHEEIWQAAWATPGVTDVENQMTVSGSTA